MSSELRFAWSLFVHGAYRIEQEWLEELRGIEWDAAEDRRKILRNEDDFLIVLKNVLSKQMEWQEKTNNELIEINKKLDHLLIMAEVRTSFNVQREDKEEEILVDVGLVDKEEEEKIKDRDKASGEIFRAESEGSKEEDLELFIGSEEEEEEGKRRKV